MQRVAWLAVLVLALLSPAPSSAQALNDGTAQLVPLVNMSLITMGPNATCINTCACLNSAWANTISSPVQLNKSSLATWNYTCDAGMWNISGLTAVGLNQSIPTTISSLWALTELKMGSAELKGEVPEEVGYLAGLQSLDLSNNNLTGSLPGSLFTLTALQRMALQDNRFNGSVVPQIGQLTNLTSLDLSGNDLTGDILFSLGALSNLQTLNLSSGDPSSHPVFSEGFSSSQNVSLTSLTSMDLSGMKFSADLNKFNWGALTSLERMNWTHITSDVTLTIPRAFGALTRLSLVYDSNNVTCPTGAGDTSNDGSGWNCDDKAKWRNPESFLCRTCPDSCNNLLCPKHLSAGEIVGIVIGGAVLLMLVLAGVYFLLRQRDYLGGVEVQGVRRFSILELEKATNKYNQSNFLGKGGFGEVFKGTLAGGEVVAVKRTVAKRRQKNVRAFDNSFKNEILVLSEVGHVNLVKLLGYCSQKTDLLLVYEFIPNGSVDDFLQRELKENGEGEVVLTWARRLHLAAGAATGLDYLHTGKSPPILHRDIKSSNILVDAHFNAKVADFGLSKSRPEEAEHQGTKVQGTPGYLDPEYAQSGVPTEKSDVYSFGVVILELATGWRPITDRHITSKVARAVNANGFESIIAPSLKVEAKLQGAPSVVGSPLQSSSAAGSSTVNPHSSSSTQGSSRVNPTSSSDAGSLNANTVLVPNTFSSNASSTERRRAAPEEARPEAPREGGTLRESTEPHVALHVGDGEATPLTVELFTRFVKLGMQCCARNPMERPLMKGVAKAISELMEGRTDLTSEVRLQEDDRFEEYNVDRVVVMPHNVGGNEGSTVAFVMDSGLQTRIMTQGSTSTTM